MRSAGMRSLVTKLYVRGSTLRSERQIGSVQSRHRAGLGRLG